MLDDLLHDAARHVDGHGEPDPDIAAAGRQDGRVDSDELAAQVYQRSARIAGIDRGVSLDEVLVSLDPKTTASQRADDPRSHRLPESERVADGDHEIAHFKLV